MSDELATYEASLVRRAGKWISKTIGTYRDKVTVGLALKRIGKVVSIEEITHAQYGKLTGDELFYKQVYARGRAWKAVNLLLHAGTATFPIYDAGGHHKLTGIKTIDEDNCTEKDLDAMDTHVLQCQARYDIAKAKLELVKLRCRQLRKHLALTNGNGAS